MDACPRGAAGHDPFSHSLAGAVWVPHEWLAELVLAAVYDAAGWSGLVLLTAAAYALSLALLTRFLLRYVERFLGLDRGHAGRRAGIGSPAGAPSPALPCRSWCCGRVPSSPHATPGCTTLPSASGDGIMGQPARQLYVWAGSGVLSRRRGRAGAGRRRRRGAALGDVRLARSRAAHSITPNGIAGFLEPFQLIAMPALQASFGEWQSPNFQEFQPLEIWLLGIIALGFATGAKLPLPRLLLLLALCHMALAHVRHAELLGLVGPLGGGRLARPAHHLADPVDAALGVRPGAPGLAAPAAAPAVMLTLVLAVSASLPLLLRPIARADDRVTPASALAAAARMGLDGPVLNSEGFGGYLIFRGIPTFIDGRAELYGNAFLDRYLAAERRREPALAAVLDALWHHLDPAGAAAGCHQPPRLPSRMAPRLR